MSETDGQWEYETLRPPRGPTKKEAVDPKAQLNELGGDGWELVTTVEYVGGGTKYMVFKRPSSASSDTNTDTDCENDDGPGTGDGDDDTTDADGADDRNDGTDVDTDGETDSAANADDGEHDDGAAGEGER